MEAYSLFEVNQYIKRVIALNFDESIWVECEINQISDSRGNLYLDLIEKDQTSDQIIAKSSATLWYRQLSFIKKKLGPLSDSILTEGVKVKLKVLIDFSERYGLSLNIQDIDASYTFGQFEMNRQKILNKLNEKGLTELNGQLALPTIIKRIAVISSSSAAGFQDFNNQLKSNIYQYTFHSVLFQAAMQGQKTEREVVAALREIKTKDFDVIVIIRGGGSKLDLSSFDNYNIAYEISQSEIPVFTGIGHDIDMTVCDIVSNQILKTPTAVANFIIDHNLNFESEITYMLQQIKQTATLQLQYKKQDLIRLESELKTDPIITIKIMEQELDNTYKLIESISKNIIEVKKSEIHKMEMLIELLDPAQVLKRGFTLVRQNGEYKTKKSDIHTNNNDLEIEFHDGVVDVKIKQDEK